MIIWAESQANEGGQKAFLFAFDSAHVKYGVCPGCKLIITLFKNSRRIPKMSVFLPFEGGIVDGGVVDGSVDKIKEKRYLYFYDFIQL